MNFKNPALEKLFKSFKWARNNTIEMFEKADDNGILDYKASSKKFTFQPIIWQFQCIVTTTDTYYRILTNNKNKKFGILVRNDEVIQKRNIKKQEISYILKQQLIELEKLLKDFDEKKFEENVNKIQAISNHEYMHHGILLLMFREAGVDLPERFRKAFAL
ncbi:hypothetical protein A3C25_01275 [Candidatus Roizmanbacteria bacterium RIFCSPHIGHO2_02_FULL_38_11]|uniref:DinB-like domain-containing protein n=1 Tax=Candidatus Roizmanbacteria bacterium RIFCSPHIGHO2_02_FULL_38_11 TaxID=1802039 RepID=A0A1F7H2G3_9BACT|nr:MAG: hypothetical protein A3C25_01275 [Candidatus Roizmanbacteria bacterium RIFCSPHIGHO2_02_FULL_38_11]